MKTLMIKRLLALLVVGIVLGGFNAAEAQVTYTVGGNLSGLSAGKSLVLLNNGNPLTLSANGAFTFSGSLASGANYAVSVGIQPVGMTCSISNNLGIIGSVNVTNVAVSCASVYTVGGSISGLTKSGLVLKLNGGTSKIVVSNSTSYVFSTALISGSAYSVTVQNQPAGLTCTLSNGSGTITNANVTNAGVTCAINTIPITFTYSYDALGRVSHAAGSDGSSITYQYDANGNVTLINRQ